MVDEDGNFFFLVPILVGAIIGGTAGGVIAHNNGQDWWKGAIVGGLIGAWGGSLLAPALGATGITTATGALTQGWGITTGILNSAMVNMSLSALQGQGLEGAWKSGLVGAASGGFTATGGLGLAKHGLLGKLAFQGIGTAGRSIGANWAADRGLLSRVTLGVGPVNLTLGKGQRLLQWQNNIGNIATNALGLGNMLTGGSMGFNWSNLTTTYSGGVLGKAYDFAGTTATGAHSVLGSNPNEVSSVFGHELHHIWQSRSMGDAFMLNYGMQMINALTMGEDPFRSANYFESQASGNIWNY